MAACLKLPGHLLPSGKKDSLPRQPLARSLQDHPRAANGLLGTVVIFGVNNPRPAPLTPTSPLAESGSDGASAVAEGEYPDQASLPEELKTCPFELVNRVNQNILDRGKKVTFDDIAGLQLHMSKVVQGQN